MIYLSIATVNLRLVIISNFYQLLYNVKKIVKEINESKYKNTDLLTVKTSITSRLASIRNKTV